MSTPQVPTGEQRAAAAGTEGGSAKPWIMLGLATLGFAINFWAWALLSPLAPQLKEQLGLTA
ncbi:MAG: MFS transporter, partial [Actinomycetes bacterium]